MRGRQVSADQQTIVFECAGQQDAAFNDAGKHVCKRLHGDVCLCIVLLIDGVELIHDHVAPDDQA